jgi:hypothetical protein
MWAGHVGRNQDVSTDSRQLNPLASMGSAAEAGIRARGKSSLWP